MNCFGRAPRNVHIKAEAYFSSGRVHPTAENRASELIWPCATRSRDESRPTHCPSHPFISLFIFLFRRGSGLRLGCEPFETRPVLPVFAEHLGPLVACGPFAYLWGE